jgi:putative ABC transport system permease protein
MTLYSPTLSCYALRQMLRRPGRTLFTLLGIAVGVATIVAVNLTTQTTRGAYREMFLAVTGKASLEVVAEGFGGFDAALAGRLGDVPGVKAALPVIQTPAALVSASGPIPVLVLGIDPTADRAARDYVLDRGRLLEAGDAAPGSAGLLLEAGFARSSGCVLGKLARFWTPTGITELSVVGLLEARGAATFNGGAVAFMPLPAAQRIFGLAGKVNSVQIVLDENSSEAAVSAALTPRLPPGLHLQTPSWRS